MATSRVQLAISANPLTASGIGSDSDSLMLQHETQLKPFYRWIQHNFNKKNSISLTTSLGVFGFCVAIAGTYTSYDPLGKGFGDITADALHAETYALAFELFFGITAYAAIGTLVGMPTKAEFEHNADYFLRNPQLLTGKDRKKTRFLATIGSIFVSIFTGQPFYKLLEDSVAKVPFLRATLPKLVMIACYCACRHTFRDLLNNAFSKTVDEPDTIKNMRKELMGKISLAKKSLEKMSNKDFRSFMDDFTESYEENPQMGVNTFLSQLFLTLPAEYLQLANAVEDNLSEVKKHKIQLLAEVIGAGCGLISSYVLYPLALETADSWLDSWEVEDPNAREVFRQFTASLAVSANVFFNSMFAKFGTENICNGILSGKRPSGNSLVAHGISVLSATPNTYLAIIAAEKTQWLYSLILPTFLGTFLSRAMGFEQLTLGLYRTCKKKTLADVRFEMIAISNKIQNGIKHLPSDMIPPLYNSFIKTDQHPVEVIAASASPVKVTTVSGTLFNSKKTLLNNTTQVNEETRRMTYGTATNDS